MTTLSLQRKPFDSVANPFLKASNPYRITQKFYTSTSSQDKYKKSYFDKQFYNSSCNHCTKNISLLDEMNTKSTYLKVQKQNLQKMSTTRYKNQKIASNPFDKKYLMNQSLNTENSYNEYSKTDESNLRNLLQNNPFKKYQHQKQNIDQNKCKQMDIDFNHINLKKIEHTQNYRENTSRLLNNNHQKKQSARFSIQSLNNNSQRINSLQNSPVKKSKFSPTIIDIGTYRGDSSKKSINQHHIIDSQINCLMRQISQSRKELFQQNKYQKQITEIYINSNITTKLPPKSPQKQTKQVHQTSQQVITIRGRKFYLNQVKIRY